MPGGVIEKCTNSHTVEGINYRTRVPDLLVKFNLLWIENIILYIKNNNPQFIKLNIFIILQIRPRSRHVNSTKKFIHKKISIVFCKLNPIAETGPLQCFRF